VNVYVSGLALNKSLLLTELHPKKKEEGGEKQKNCMEK
jgi:hypothetical protein